MLDKFKEYYRQAKLMQEYKFQGMHDAMEVYAQVDGLVWNVPIYDVVNRKYAAFSSFPEAIKYKEKDEKGNGLYFKASTVPEGDFAYMCYLFRLCGSGINYKPTSEDTPWFKSHGFGNFWIVDAIRRGYYRSGSWLSNIPDSRFSDSKGYLLPMISKGLRNFILEDSEELFEFLWDYLHGQKAVTNRPLEIFEVVDHGNDWLQNRGFKRQAFVLTAWAMDLAEYFPNLVDPNSNVYFGSNAKRCYKLIFPGEKATFTKMNENVRMLCEITGNHSKPYDMEDVMCDFIRYIDNYQSDEHIKLNDGKKYYNKYTNNDGRRIQ